MGLKKLLSFLALIMLILVVTGGYFVWERYQKNPEQIFPYPYRFQSEAPALKPNAPILIVGDRMGAYFAKFITELAASISRNLEKPIKIQSIAMDGFALHRTLHQLKNTAPWPQIVIYQGGSEEFFEQKFELSEIPLIAKNFERYQDERIETFLILYPWLSRLVYEPMKRTTLAPTPTWEKEITEEQYLERLETELLLFEQQMIQLVEMSKDRNSLLILTTTPINLDIPPKEVCDFTSNLEVEKVIFDLRELLKKNDLKSAYLKSSQAVKKYLGNALLLYIHGQIARRLGNLEEAKVSLLEASAYDCRPWRATELNNSIIRKVARDHQVLLFDFARLVEKDWVKNTTFFDEIHAQNLYYEKGMHQLGLVIKQILKL